MSKLFLEVLTQDRKDMFHKLSPFRDVGYLAGGTALALQIGHRQSYDFDIFIDQEINNTLRKRLSETLSIDRYIVNTGDQITCISGNISITFLWYYFKRITPLVSTTYLPLASVEDIAADKAMTIGRRAVWRDYVDIFFLLKSTFSLAEIITFARNKFNEEFVETQFLEQLVFFDDVTIAPVEYIHGPASETEIKDTLKEQVERHVTFVKDNKKRT